MWNTNEAMFEKHLNIKNNYMKKNNIKKLLYVKK